MSLTPSAKPRAARTLGPVRSLAARRMARDKWLVLASAVVVGLASLLAYAGPQVVLGTLDDGAADALKSGETPGAVDITFPVGNPDGNNVDSVRGLPADVAPDAAGVMVENLPPDLASIVIDYEFWAQAPTMTLLGVYEADELAAAEEADRDPRPRTPTNMLVTVGFIDGLDPSAIEGRLPSITADQRKPGDTMPAAKPLEVALTAAVADELGVGVGDQLEIARMRGDRMELVVVGIIDLTANSEFLGERIPEALEPFATSAGVAQDRTHVGIILGSEATAAFTSRTETPMTAVIRLAIDPEKLTYELARTVPGELDNLATSSEDLLPDTGITPHVDTALADALAGYPVRARAALSQMSVLIAGVVAAAAGVIALMARLVVSGRMTDIALERARGASSWTTAVALLIEHALVTAVGVGLGYGASVVLAPGANPLDPLVGFVAAVSLLAAPILGWRVALGMWRGKRAPANRTDRARASRAERAKSITRDVVVVGLAALAVLSLRNRSVLASTDGGVDIFLAAGPVLLSLAVTVLVVRAYPAPMRIIQALARRTRGIAGLLTLSRARERVSVLPLMTLALSIAVAASGALLSSTVIAGQEKASWERVGGDARLDQALTPAQVSALEDRGLLVSTVLSMPYATVALGSNLDAATVLAVDAHWADVVEAAGLDGADELRALTAAAADWKQGDPLPAIASPSVAALDVYDRSDIFVGKSYVPIAIDGVASTATEGWAPGPYVIVPLEQLLQAEVNEPFEANVTVIDGAGADAAIADLGLEDTTVLSRHAWLDAARGSALIGGVQRVMVLAVAAVAALAAVGLLVSVIDGSRRRSRALALLRTQGVGTRYGWWLAAAELVPLIVAATLAGAAGAGLVVWLLRGTLGLGVLTGGVSAPVLAVNTLHLGLGGAGIAALALAAILAEVVAQRRSKLSEVLRYGETR